jgi:hypothetical protein
MTKKIDLSITHDYLNPFASPDNPKLSPELVDYLSDSAWYHPELCQQIRCPEDERERLQQAISNTFAEKSEQLRVDIRTQRLGKAFSNGKKMTRRHFLRRPHCYAFNTSMDSGNTYTTQ